jgi:hypothetical protein
MRDYGRYYSGRDVKFINSINAEVIRDLIDTIVILYKISAENTNTNIYGETSGDGKYFEQGLSVPCLIEHPDTSTRNEGFGPDKQKSMQFRFQELQLYKVNFYPNVGDIVEWDNGFFEITNVLQEQHLGGQYEKSHSIICDAFLTRYTKLNLIQRNNI